MRISVSGVIAAICALLIGLGVIWWLKNFDRVDQRVYKGLKGEAREDRFLAMKRFLARMEVKTDESQPNASNGVKFAGWAPRGTVILGDRRHVIMTPERVKQTLAWVEAGGYLILEAEFPGRPDPLLTALEIDRKGQPRNNRPIRRDMPAAERAQAWAQNNITDVSIPGNPRVLKAQFSPYQSLSDPKNRALWKVENDQGLRMVHLKRGAGRVTVVSNFDWMIYAGTYGVKDERSQPTNIGKFDHAEMLMTLIRLNPDYAKSTLRLIWGQDEVSLIETLLNEAWMALAALALLIVFWLARVIPRFGPLQHEPPPAEQRLAAHLEASGRFFWKYLAPHQVYAKIRDAFDKRLAERRPGLAGMRNTDRYKELARIIDVRPEAVARALEGPTQSAADFVRNVRLLQRLLQKI